MKVVKFIAVLAALSLSMSAMCQTVANSAALEKMVSKYAKQEAKRMKKEGWISIGVPLEEQLERCYNMQLEHGDDGPQCMSWG